MNSLVLAPFSTKGLDSLNKLGFVAYEPWTESKLIHDPQLLGERIARENFNVLIVEADFLFDELFKEAKNLYFAALCRSSLNQVELDEAIKHGITIVHTPNRNAQAVAELVLGVIFSLLRHIHSSNIFIKRGEWEVPTDPYIRFKGREISSVKLGIVGLGNIGTKVAALANKLGIEVSVYDPYAKAKIVRMDNVKFMDLDDLFAECNIVTLHLADNEQTLNMIQDKQLSLLGPESFLINTSSPSIVNEDHLYNALVNGTIAGAAIDVHDSHPIPSNSKLIQLENTLLTPHIGGSSFETIDRYSSMVLKDLRFFLKGKMPKNIANPEVWPSRRTP